MKVLDFIKKKKDETASTGAIKTENSMAVIANLFIQSKKYSLLSDKYNGNVIYFVLGNDTLLYVFILRSMDDYQSKYVLKDNFGKNISIQILFNIDVNEMTEGTPFPTIENWSSIKDFLNTNKIFKTIESSSLARLAFVSMIEGLTFLSQISFSNYKIPITNSQVKQEDEEPEKQVFSETKATTIKKAIASVEEAQNDVDDTIGKKDEVEDTVASNKNSSDEDESVIKATSEDISKHTFEEISKKVEDMTPKSKTTISTKYFIGYKVVNSLDSTGKEIWTYELNKDKKLEKEIEIYNTFLKLEKITDIKPITNQSQPDILLEMLLKSKAIENYVKIYGIGEENQQYSEPQLRYSKEYAKIFNQMRGIRSFLAIEYVKYENLPPETKLTTAVDTFMQDYQTYINTTQES